jgi:hypothetical protein
MDRRVGHVRGFGAAKQFPQAFSVFIGHLADRPDPTRFVPSFRHGSRSRFAPFGFNQLTKSDVPNVAREKLRGACQRGSVGHGGEGTRLRQDKPGASLEHGVCEGSSNEGASTVIMRRRGPSSHGNPLTRRCSRVAFLLRAASCRCHHSKVSAPTRRDNGGAGTLVTRRLERLDDLGRRMTPPRQRTRMENVSAPRARLASIGQLRRIDQGNARKSAKPSSFRSIDDRQGSTGRPLMYIR